MSVADWLFEAAWHLAQAPWWLGPTIAAGGVLALGILIGAHL